MSDAAPLLPISDTLEPTDGDQVVEFIEACHRDDAAVYPVGGATSLRFGMPGAKEGVGLSLGKLHRIVDHQARDMTITVEAGVKIAALAETLAAEGQRLPFDVPAPHEATIGGVVATNFNGPRRYGLGAVRDYLIGVTAVDGAGLRFRGGGRVVKNVAGYDFCKLLTGSLGTLGVITQMTFKVVPLPSKTALVFCRPGDYAAVERLLAGLATETQTTPVAIESLHGREFFDDPALAAISSDDSPLLAVGLEGSEEEVDWQVEQLSQEWKTQGVDDTVVIDEQAESWWRRLAEFPAQPAAMSIEAHVAPSGVTSFMEAALQVDPHCSLVAHAGRGAVIAQFPELPKEGLGRALVGQLQPAAARHRGGVRMLFNPGGAEATRQAVWGPCPQLQLMSEVKRRFDPKNLLNSGRYIFA